MALWARTLGCHTSNEQKWDWIMICMKWWWWWYAEVNDLRQCAVAINASHSPTQDLLWISRSNCQYYMFHQWSVNSRKKKYLLYIYWRLTLRSHRATMLWLPGNEWKKKSHVTQLICGRKNWWVPANASFVRMKNQNEIRRIVALNEFRSHIFVSQASSFTV